jgi:hypothetical protein
MVAGMFIIFVFPGFYAPTLVGDSPHIGVHWKSAIVEYDPKNENVKGSVPHNRISSFPFCIAQQVRQRTRSTQFQAFGNPVHRHGRFLAQPARQRHFIFSPARPLCPPTNPRSPHPPLSKRTTQGRQAARAQREMISWRLPVRLSLGGGGCDFAPLRLKRGGFWGICQEYILDKRAPDTRFDQCLQGFRVLKKGVIMTCTNSAFYAKIFK